MVQYRRNLLERGTYFFTVTLADRRSNLLTQYVEVLQESVKKVQQQYSFDGGVTRPPAYRVDITQWRCDYSGRWLAIKSHFVRNLKKYGVAIPMLAEDSAILWQRRFWEHTVKNDEDLRHCVDYCYI